MGACQEDLIRQALSALHLYIPTAYRRRRPGVDEYARLIMPDPRGSAACTRWSRPGKVEISGRRNPGPCFTSLFSALPRGRHDRHGEGKSRVSYGRHHWTLCAFPNRRSRQHQPDSVYSTSAKNGEYRRACLRTARGPVLVGTRSVADSGTCLASSTSRRTHSVLNARQNRTGRRSLPRPASLGVTVATNMAGRGTDIKLAESVAGRRSLCHCFRAHDARRIDRQLWALRSAG